jgi:hypothetical protein
MSPKIGADPSGNLHVVWRDDTPGHWKSIMPRAQMGSATWTASQGSPGLRRPALPSSALIPGTACMVWGYCFRNIGHLREHGWGLPGWRQKLSWTSGVSALGHRLILTISQSG